MPTRFSLRAHSSPLDVLARFGAILQLIETTGAALEGRRILLYSYGSGMSATMLSLVGRATESPRFALSRLQATVRRTARSLRAGVGAARRARPRSAGPPPAARSRCFCAVHATRAAEHMCHAGLLWLQPPPYQLPLLTAAAPPSPHPPTHPPNRAVGPCDAAGAARAKVTRGIRAGDAAGGAAVRARARLAGLPAAACGCITNSHAGQAAPAHGGCTTRSPAQACTCEPWPSPPQPLPPPAPFARRSYCAGNYKPEMPSVDELEPGTFYLVEVDARYRRAYARKPPSQ